MDPQLINGIVAVALAFLAIGVVALCAVAAPLVTQIGRTLVAYEKLADTLEAELGPTLKEVQKVVVGVGELKQIAGQTMTGVSTKVEDVTDNLGKAADTAAKHSSVWGTGLMAGLRSYFDSASHPTHTPANSKVVRKSADTKHLAMDRGEENVGLKR